MARPQHRRQHRTRSDASTALAPLGIPFVDPNDGGSVDLEILVGEDGVARTIRRAVPVVVRQE
jgi:hypothetical protein